MATHSSILAWRIPWTEEPGRLQSMGSQRVGRDWVTKHSTYRKQGLVSLICILFCRPVHGLIFLFKWQPGEEPAGSVVQDSRLDTIFFAKQVWSLDTLNSQEQHFL